MTDSSQRQIIYSNDLGKLRKRLSGHKGKIRYLILGDLPEFAEIHTFLSGIEGSEVIDLESETRNLRCGFRSKYIELIAGLNESNHSIAWWALYFTRKELLFTDFSEKIFNCLLIKYVIQQSLSDDHVIVTNDSLLVDQMGDWANSLGIDHVNDLSQGWQLKERARSFTIGRMLLTLLLAFRYWLILRVSLKISIDKQKSYVVVGSLINETSFLDDGRYNDTYLGELPEFLRRNDSEVLIFGGIAKDHRKVLRTIRKNRTQISVIPWYYYGSIGGILGAWWSALCFHISPPALRGSTEIDGMDFRRIIKHEIANSLRTGHLFNNLWLRNSARSLGKSIGITALAIPYENRSWEKMLLDGLAQGKEPISTVGYHHAAIGPGHSNMLLGENEAAVLPLPDTIITTGEITETILRTSGNYPKNTLKAGSALRQGRKIGRIRHRNEHGEIINVLVALASSTREYRDTLTFLDQAFLEHPSYRVGIRPHPEFSLDQSLAQLPHLNLQFQRMEGALSDNFDWADAVVYVSSTVGLEAVSVGIPAISIDLGKFTSCDPAPAACPLKWSVCDPKQLVPTFRQIEALSASDYESQQSEAVEFGRRYFRPVTDESLIEFSNFLLNKVEA